MTGNLVEKRCLARPVAAQKCCDTALGYVQANAFQYQNDVIVDHLDIVDLKQGLGGFSGVKHGVTLLCLIGSRRDCPRRRIS